MYRILLLANPEVLVPALTQALCRIPFSNRSRPGQCPDHDCGVPTDFQGLTLKH